MGHHCLAAGGGTPLFGGDRAGMSLLSVGRKALCSKSLAKGACSGAGAGAAGGGRMASSAESAASLLLRGLQLRHQHRIATATRKRMRRMEITAMPGGVELHGFSEAPLIVPPLGLVVPPLGLVVFVAGRAACVGTCCEMYGVDEVAVVVSGVDGW